MKRTGIQRRTELKRTTPLSNRGGLTRTNGYGKHGNGPRRTQARHISPASDAQRRKVMGRPCLGCGREASEWLTIDPAHLAARGFHGGCDDPLCVVPLCRDGAGVGCHSRLDGAAFEEEPLDLLKLLVRRWVPELQHALGHYDGDLLGLTHRLTGERHVPERRAA